MRWVDHEAIRTCQIDEGWRRFKYYCNEHLQYIYAMDKETFIALFIEWSVWSGWNGYVGRYSYNIADLEGEPISLKDMIMDRPEGTEYRCKMLLHTKDGREYIQ